MSLTRIGGGLYEYFIIFGKKTGIEFSKNV